MILRDVIELINLVSVYACQADLSKLALRVVTARVRIVLSGSYKVNK